MHGEQPVVAHEIPEFDRHEPECFLCTFDPTKNACVQPEIEGRLIAIEEQTRGNERNPVVLLESGTSYIAVELDGYYYRSLLRELKARSDVLNKLKVRIYHLPTAPVEHEGKSGLDLGSYLYYRGNAYTLAILEPDMLLNITDLNQAEYCARQYLLRRLSPSGSSPATIRGNLIHHCFKELLKAHDRGYFKDASTETETEQEIKKPLAFMHYHLEKALEINHLDMALNSVSDEAMREDVAPHLESLTHWFEVERETLWDMPGSYAEAQSEQESGNKVRAETFLLSPEVGLRGRLDLFWQQAGRQRLLELKTGNAKGELPKRDHRWQVYGYHMLLSVRRDSQMKKALATLLYSGTPDSAQAIGMSATIREIQRVNERRNILVLGRVSMTPPAPPGPSRCSKCSIFGLCRDVSTLLHWQQPVVEEDRLAELMALHNRPVRNNDDREFFVRYYTLLRQEGGAGELQQAQLWQTSVEQRIERGTALGGLVPIEAPVIEKDGWEQHFRCANTSELREGDEILLSNGNPVVGEVVTGTIVQSSSEEITVWTRELIAHPVLLDRYDSDIVHVRTVQNLLRWLNVNAHMRDLVAGRIRPRFQGQAVPPRADFNLEQNLAVERALEMQDYLLVHGPPGTGKTSVIAEIVKRLCARKQRVLLAAFTNQAVDNILKRLNKEGFHEYIRLGHQRSVAEEIRPHLLKELADKRYYDRQQEEEAYVDIVSNLLYDTQVIASTTATWSAEKYVPAGEVNANGEKKELGLEFDVAIIDEAGQLTVPAILGALRFARRFILVGDEKQLPPLVLSKEAAEQGLNESLFSQLKKADDIYMQEETMAIGACVTLRTQYRMNRWIANFASTVFYDRQLIAHPSVADQKLNFGNKRDGKNGLANTSVERALEPGLPLVFLDVRDNGLSDETKISNGEAHAVRALVAELLKKGIQPQDIGVIAPYRAQVANIRRYLLTSDPTSNWQGLPVDTPLSVDTVDRFQGGERMVILMSFATTHEPTEGSQRRDFLTNPNRLNVALTRAQRKLIVLGSVAALEHLPYFGRLITYCRSMKTVFSYTTEPTSDVEEVNAARG
jgi:DNA replication ATP-dependent helicase Dna2